MDRAGIGFDDSFGVPGWGLVPGFLPGQNREDQKRYPDPVDRFGRQSHRADGRHFHAAVPGAESERSGFRGAAESAGREPVHPVSPQIPLLAQ